MDEFGLEEDDYGENLLGNSDLRAVVEATPALNVMEFGRNEKCLTQIDEMLEEGERPLAAAAGQSPNQAGKDTIGIAVVTNKRLIYVGTLMFQTAVEQFPLSKVDSVQESKGLALAGFSASVPGSTFTLSRANKDAVKSFVETLRNAINDFQSETTSVEHQSSEGALDKIKKLSELHEAGVLTDEEFESKKAELLDQI